MTSKSENAKRLGIYLLISFAGSLLLILFRKPAYSSRTAFFIVQEIFCMSPAIACIVTRAVTKEGFRNMKLHLRLKGNLRYYLFAFLLLIVIQPIMKLLPIFLNGHSEWLSSFTGTNIAASVLQLISSTIIGSIVLLGEELGWRAYMNQRMEPLLGIFGTCLAGGVIWGLWHFPIDIANYLNGYIDLSGAMYNAFERMLMTVMFGVVLMWVTKKTDSIFPAVILHMMNNASVSVADNMLLLGGMPENYSPAGNAKIITSICGLLPLFVLAVIFMTLMIKDERKHRPSD